MILNSIKYLFFALFVSGSAISVQTYYERSPAADPYVIGLEIVADSKPAGKAVAIYNFQEQVLSGIEDSDLTPKKFQKAIEEAQNDVNTIERYSHEVKQTLAPEQIIDIKSDQVDFKSGSPQILKDLEHMRNYDFALLANGEFRFAPAQVFELEVDNLNQLIAQNRHLKSAKLLTANQETTAIGEMTVYKKSGKYFIFMSPESEIQPHIIKQALSNFDINPLNIAVLSKDSNWGKVVYQNYPSHIALGKIKKEHMFGYLEGQFKKWKSSLDVDAIIDRLDRIIDGEVFDLSSSEFKYFKEQRKRAAILRNGYYSYTKSGKSPKDFDKFTKIFGKVNDAIQSQNQEKMISMARKFKKYLKEDSKIEKMQLDVNLISGTSLHKRMTKLGQEIAMALELNTLSIDEFHDMRKHLKLFLLLVQDMNAGQGDQLITTQMGQELDHIVTRLGDWHDTHLSHQLQGMPVLESFSIEATDRRLIQEALNRTNAVLKTGNCHQILGDILGNAI